MARPRGGFPGGLGGGNMNQLMQQAQKMQQDMQKAQEEIAAMEIEYSAGGGMVTAKINGEHKLLDLTIAPEAVDPEDVEMLQDLVVSAVNEALRQAGEAMDKSMEGVTGGLDLSGFGL